MATSLESIQMNPDAENNGVWATFPGTDIELRIARAWNGAMLSEYMRMKAEKAASMQGKAKPQGEDDDDLDITVQPLRGQLLARTVLLDWRNITVKGEPLPYSVAVGERYLCDPAFHDLTNFVSAVSLRREQYLAATGASGN